MKNWSRASLKYGVVFVSCAFLLAWACQDIQGIAAQSKQNPALAPPAALSAADKAAIENFDKQIKSFLQLRNKVREKAPKLSKDSTPEQIHAYRMALEESVRNARVGAKRGEFFRPEIAEYIRRTL